MKNKKKIITIIKFSWLLICFYIGITYFNKGPSAGEHTVTFISMMSIVTFPIGYLAIYLLRAMVWFFSTVINYDMTGSYNFFISLWVFMTSLGYFQWFYLIPKIFEKVKILKST